MDFTVVKITFGVLATIGLYSVLYKETKFYRFFEHMFLGLAAGYSIVAFWKDNLYNDWWLKMVGRPATGADPAERGYWIYIVLLPVGLLGYTVFSKKNNWMSRIPIGIILGLWSGQQVEVWWRQFGPQIYGSMLPLIPNNTSSFRVPFTGSGTPLTPDQIAIVQASHYPSEALSNLIFVITVLAALSYFIFSYEIKGKFLMGVNTAGRWLLMIGFGAIFGSTVMARFALEIDRMAYIWLEWIQAIQNAGGGG